MIYSKSTISTYDKVIQKNQINYLKGIEKKLFCLFEEKNLIQSYKDIYQLPTPYRANLQANPVTVRHFYSKISVFYLSSLFYGSFRENFYMDRHYIEVLKLDNQNWCSMNCKLGRDTYPRI